MARQVLVVLVCLATVVLFSGQESIDQARGFRVKPKLQGGPFVLQSVRDKDGNFLSIVPKPLGGGTIQFCVQGVDANDNPTVLCKDCPAPVCPEEVSFSNWNGVYPPDNQQAALLQLINSRRGAQKLTWHTGLTKAAIDHLMTDAPDPLNFETAQFPDIETVGTPPVSVTCIVKDSKSPCYSGFSNIFQNLTFGPCPTTCAGAGGPGQLSRLFVTTGRADAHKLLCNCSEIWDIVGRCRSAEPEVQFDDLAIILAQQEVGGTQTGSASSLFWGGLETNQYGRAVIAAARFTHFGCAFDDRLGTWVLVFGQNARTGLYWNDSTGSTRSGVFQW